MCTPGTARSAHTSIAWATVLVWIARYLRTGPSITRADHRKHPVADALRQPVLVASAGQERWAQQVGRAQPGSGNAALHFALGPEVDATSRRPGIHGADADERGGIVGRLPTGRGPLGYRGRPFGMPRSSPPCFCVVPMQQKTASRSSPGSSGARATLKSTIRCSTLASPAYGVGRWWNTMILSKRGAASSNGMSCRPMAPVDPTMTAVRFDIPFRSISGASLRVAPALVHVTAVPWHYGA